MTDTLCSPIRDSAPPQGWPRQASTEGWGGVLGAALHAGVLLTALYINPAHANPTGAQVVNGAATFNTSGSTLTVTNSNNAIINWQAFSINAGETTRFVQPSATSSVLNRVQGGDPSKLLGQLQSNGKVFLVNPAGILVGEGARIDVGALVASTLGLSDEDFLAGRLNFLATGNAGSVVNQGVITTGVGGTVILSGPVVSNEGSISAPQGQVLLAAGQTVRLTELGAPGLSIEVTGADTTATNLGQITADAGTVGIVGALVKNRGVVSASSVTREGGRIFLRASLDGHVEGSGRLQATGRKGGRIEVTGQRVAVMDQASLDASGEQGGGRVMVGGDWQGKNPDVANAQETYFGPDASIKVDAKQSGDGGTAVVWADGSTRAHGTISAKGGEIGGAGGLIETSGKQTLDVRGIRIDTQAADGTAGTWLLDPTDINIIPGTSGGGLSGSTVTDGDINNATSNIVITTQSSNTENGDITVQSDVYIYNSIYALSLQADRDIVLQSANVNSSAVSISAARDILITDSVIDTSGQMDIAAGRNLAVKSALATGSASMPGAGLVTWGGAQNITVGDTLTVQGSPTVSGGSATISSYGSQSISARQIDVIAGGTGASNVSEATASIKAEGDQTINAAVGGIGGIRLQGGGVAGGYLNSAVIARGSLSGVQTINLQTADSSIILQGGAGSGDSSTSQFSSCGGGSCNYAAVDNQSGDTSITFTGSGNSLTLTGGGVASDYGNNEARISANAGTLSVGSSTSRPDVLLTGGGAGGVIRLDESLSPLLDANGLPETFGNSAVLDGKVGTTIYAANLTLRGGNAAAGISGISSAGESPGTGMITIDVADNLTLTGGAGNSAFPQYPFMSGAAGIGADLDVSINLTVGRDLSMTGGGPSATVLIGSLAADSTATVVTSIAGKAELKAAGAGLAAVGSGLAALGGVSGVIARDLTAGSIFLESSNDVSLEGPLTATGNGIAINALGNFVNNATTPFVLTGGGRWLVYAAAPANVTKNGLTSDFRRYNNTYANYPPAGVIESGNGFIYASAPTVSVNTSLASGSASHVYGDTPTAIWSYSLTADSTQIDAEDVGTNFGVSGTPLYSLATSASDAGSYTVAYLSGLSSSSGVTLSPGTSVPYAVYPRPITVTADAQSKVYGDALPSLTYTVGGSGLVNGDTLAGALATAATANSDVGSYSITQGTLDAGNNYLFSASSFTGSTLSVTQRPLALSFASVSKTYDGNTTATFSAPSISNALSADLVNLSVSGTGVYVDANVGTGKTVNYSSLALSGSASSNYSLSASTGSGLGDVLQLASVAWVGSSTGDWLSAGNWAGGAVPINNNVAQININSPLAATSSQAVNLGSTKVVSAGDFSLDITGGFASGAGVIDVTGSLNITTRSPMTIGSGGITSTGGVTLQASTADSTSTIALNGAISSTGGAINVQAYSDITQSSSIGAPSVSLTSSSGSISLTSSALTDSASITYSAPSGSITYSTLNFTGSTPALDAPSLVNTSLGTTSSVTQAVAASTNTSLDSAVTVVSAVEPVPQPTNLSTSESSATQTTTETSGQTGPSTASDTSTQSSGDSTGTSSTDSNTSEGGGGTTVSTVVLSPTSTTTTSTTPTSTLPGGTIGGGVDEFGGTTTTTTSTATDASSSNTTTGTGDSTTTASSSTPDSSTKESSSAEDSKSNQASTAESKEDKQQKEASNGRIRKPSPKMCT